MTTVDRHKWIAERLRFLQAELDRGDVSDDQRAAIEAEIAQLRKEAGGPGRWLKRLAGLPRRPTDR
jgi:hypothetical protein